MKSSSTRFLESFKEAELSVSDHPGSTRGLAPEALCTSYEDLEKIFSHPLVKGTWVDLGSGYGQTVDYYSRRFPDRSAVGVEREQSRVKACHSLGMKGTFHEADLLNCVLPEGDTYFLYFPQGHVLDRILSELSKKDHFTLVAIESHGDLFPRLEKEKWLRCEAEVPLHSQRHHEFARVYSKQVFQGGLAGLHRFSFLERHLLIREDSGEWWGDSFGLAADGEKYLLQYPPRTIGEKDVVKIVTTDELPIEVRFLCALRRCEEVVVHARDGIHHGPLRKIMAAPGFSVEFPSGARVQWSEIQRIFQGPKLCYDSSSPSSLSFPSSPVL